MLKKDSDFKLISSHLDTGRLDAFVAVPKASDVTLSLSLPATFLGHARQTKGSSPPSTQDSSGSEDEDRPATGFAQKGPWVLLCPAPMTHILFWVISKHTWCFFKEQSQNTHYCFPGFQATP